MYNIQIQVEAEGPLFPKELKNPELAEIAVEGAVACFLENLFTYVSIKNVTISRTSQTENKKEANCPTYTIKIHIEADASVLPYELKNTEAVELIVESAVGCSLENLYTSVALEVNINPSPRDIEQDWDALLPQDL